MDELRYMCDDSGVDIVCVSETWFRKDISDNLYSINGYNIFRSDRIGHGGGVAIYVKDKIKCCIKCSNRNDDRIEYLFAEVSCERSKLLIGWVYRPRNNIELTPIIEETEEIMLHYNEVIMPGDFNCNTLSDKSLVTQMSCLGLKPVNVITPTHFTMTNNTLLDMFFVTDKKKVLL